MYESGGMPASGRHALDRVYAVVEGQVGVLGRYDQVIMDAFRLILLPGDHHVDDARVVCQQGSPYAGIAPGIHAHEFARVHERLLADAPLLEPSLFDDGLGVVPALVLHFAVEDDRGHVLEIRE